MPARISDEHRLAAWKITTFQWSVCFVFLALLGGYWRLQVHQHQKYLDESDRNRIRNLPIIAPRGRILDREGRVLVDNSPAFSILLARENPAGLKPEHLTAMARGLDLDPQDVLDLIARTSKLPRYQPVLLKPAASLEDVSFVESHRVEYPELDLIGTEQRFYLKHDIAAALIGYVGDVSEDVIAESHSKFRPGDVVGKSGIEREYNDVLAGRDGMRRVIVNSRGQEVGSMTTLDAHPGNDLRLTVDLDLQMAAEMALGDRQGAVVALDPRTGEVLAMVSHPAFDPNDFAHGIDALSWRDLMGNPEKPLMNKATQAQLAPGSVFKIVTSTAALETATIHPSFTVDCHGEVTIYGHTYHDWVWQKRKAHGDVDLHRAIAQSCDVYFYTLGKMLGIDKLAYFAKQLGLGARTGIDLPGEDAGLMPSPEWVQRAFRRKWWAGETISVAIGQGAVEVTPLQLANLMSGVISGGTFHRPHLVFRDELEALGQNPPEDHARDFPISQETLSAVTGGLWAVVNEGGTGASAHVDGLDIAGKTGTAQVVSASLKQSAHSLGYRNNAWFIGYAPFGNPQIVVAALVMHGEESSVAAPVARDVIKAYFEKRQPPQLPKLYQARTQALLERPQ
jgi:penicillin-binding protein 2